MSEALSIDDMPAKPDHFQFDGYSLEDRKDLKDEKNDDIEWELLRFVSENREKVFLQLKGKESIGGAYFAGRAREKLTPKEVNSYWNRIKSNQDFWRLSAEVEEKEEKPA